MKINRLGGNQVKIFLSWSGEQSRQLADAFANWLPNVLQHVEPYISSKNIGLGERALDNIKNELETSSFGIVFVTKENIKAPWINYEAGAISNSLGVKKVIPVMYDCELIDLDNSPLRQFQAAKDLEQENVGRIIMAINSVSEEFKLSDDRVERAFNQWWGVLKDELAKIKTIGNSAKVNEKELSVEEMTRATYRLLQSGYIENTTNMELLLENEVEQNNRNIARKINKIILKFEKELKLDNIESIINYDRKNSLNAIEELKVLKRQLDEQSEYKQVKFKF